MKLLRRFVIRWRLIHGARFRLRRWLAAADDIAGGDVRYAEQVCPSLKRLRRAGRARCIMARRLS